MRFSGTGHSCLTFDIQSIHPVETDSWIVDRHLVAFLSSGVPQLDNKGDIYRVACRLCALLVPFYGTFISGHEKHCFPAQAHVHTGRDVDLKYADCHALSCDDSAIFSAMASC